MGGSFSPLGERSSYDTVGVVCDTTGTDCVEVAAGFARSILDQCRLEANQEKWWVVTGSRLWQISLMNGGV